MIDRALRDRYAKALRQLLARQITTLAAKTMASCQRVSLGTGVTTMGVTPDIIEAHKGCSNHREVVTTAERCGCFYCCSEFVPGEITDWVDPASDDMQAGTTALCPRCGIDSVIPIVFGMDTAFLRRMRDYWF